MNNSLTIVKNKRLISILSIATLLLLIPLVAMQFTKDVDWKLSDFVIMSILLYGTGLCCELVLRRVRKTTHRLMVCAAILLVFFFVWAELAVGIFGTPFAGS